MPVGVTKDSKVYEEIKNITGITCNPDVIILTDDDMTNPETEILKATFVLTKEQTSRIMEVFISN